MKLKLDLDFTEVRFSGFTNWQYVSTGSGNGLTPDRRKVTTWTDEGPFHNTSPNFSESKEYWKKSLSCEKIKIRKTGKLLCYAGVPKPIDQGWGLLKLRSLGNFDFLKIPVRFSYSLSDFMGVTAAELRWHLSNMNETFERDSIVN